MPTRRGSFAEVKYKAAARSLSVLQSPPEAGARGRGRRARCTWAPPLAPSPPPPPGMLMAAAPPGGPGREARQWGEKRPPAGRPRRRPGPALTVTVTSSSCKMRAE